MGDKIDNNLDNCSMNHYVGGNQTIHNIILFQDKEREFVVTHNANIKPVYYFTGRETELEELRQRIEKKRKSVLVSGMGGIGKTHICRKLFEEYFNEYDRDKSGPFRHIGYIEYSGDMDSSLLNCLKYKQQISPGQNQEAAWKELEYLASDGKLLLFIDNVDKPMGDDLGLQRLKSIPGAIILTSRQVSLGNEFEPYRIGFLGMEQCIEMYEKIRFVENEKKVKPEEMPDLKYVIENLAGKHTITVEFLAHLTRCKLWTVKRLREELEEKGFCLEFHKDGELVTIQKSYEVLYDLSMLTEAEQNILEAFSVFPYIPLQAETCNNWLLADAGVNENEDILMELYRKGWLQFDMNSESYALHPVFAQFLYEKCKPSIEKHSELVAESAKSLAIPDTGSPKECQEYLPFAENIIDKLISGDPLKKIGITKKTAYLLQYIGEYAKARKLYEDVLRIEIVYEGEVNPSTATSFSNLAGVYDRLGEYGLAEELYKKGLRISEEVLGEEHLITETIYNNLAGVYDRQGKYRVAKELYKKGLRIREELLGEEDPNTVNSYNNLAEIYFRQGQYEKAEQFYEKGLRIREKVLGEEHPSTATIYNNLAKVFDRQGAYEKAEQFYEKGLRILEKVLGEEHPDTATIYNNLAKVFDRQGAHEKAEQFYERGLRISKKMLGEGHPSTATGYNNLALVYKHQKEYEKAEKLYKKAQKISEEVLGEEHPDTAIGYHNLAGVYVGQGEYEKAERLYKKGLRILEKVLGEEHPDTAIGYNNLAGLYDSQGDYGKAEELFKKALRIREKVLGEEHPDTATSYHNLAGLYASQGEYGKAITYCIKAFKITTRTLGENHPHTKTILKI